MGWGVCVSSLSGVALLGIPLVTCTIMVESGGQTLPVLWLAFLIFDVVFLALKGSGHGQPPQAAGAVLPQEAMDEELMQRVGVDPDIL